MWIPPSLRIAALLGFAGLCAVAYAPMAAAFALLAMLTNLISGAQRAFGALLWRSRWLLVTVVLLNAFATPGPAWWGAAWLPSAAGLELALHRGSTLVAMLAAVNLLLRTTPNHDLVRGITDLARPLRSMGLAPERLGTRLAGALDALGATERELKAASGAGWLEAVVARIAAIEARAGR